MLTVLYYSSPERPHVILTYFPMWGIEHAYLVITLQSNVTISPEDNNIYM